MFRGLIVMGQLPPGSAADWRQLHPIDEFLEFRGGEISAPPQFFPPAVEDRDHEETEVDPIVKTNIASS